MERQTIEFTIHEAGGLVYAADRNFGGYPIGEFHNFFSGEEGLRELTEKGAVIAATLYQDDGFNVRVVFGEITDEEDAEWTSRIDWKLDLSSGRMVVSGVCDDDLEYTIEEFPPTEDRGEYDLGTIADVPAGIYRATIYSFPPGDLAGGWLGLSNPMFFRKTIGEKTGLKFEKPLDYFNRTRPGEVPRPWITDGWEETDFLDFVIQLRPLADEPPPIEFEQFGDAKWEFRKPEKCPVGIEFGSRD